MARVEVATSLMQAAINKFQQNGARVSFFGGRDPIANGLDSDRYLRDVYMVKWRRVSECCDHGAKYFCYA